MNLIVVMSLGLLSDQSLDVEVFESHSMVLLSRRTPAMLKAIVHRCVHHGCLRLSFGVTVIVGSAGKLVSRAEGCHRRSVHRRCRLVVSAVGLCRTAGLIVDRRRFGLCFWGFEKKNGISLRESLRLGE